jgi:hypothetical protein
MITILLVISIKATLYILHDTIQDLLSDGKSFSANEMKGFR